MRLHLDPFQGVRSRMTCFATLYVRGKYPEGHDPLHKAHLPLPLVSRRVRSRVVEEAFSNRSATLARGTMIR